MSIEEFLKIFFDSLFASRDNKELTLENSPLVSIRIDKKLDYKRYQLLVNGKKITCVSHKTLEIGRYYWCIISLDKDGIITLSKLKKQPDFFQSSSFFSFDMPFGKIVENLNTKDRLSYYIGILNTQKIPMQNHIKSFIFCAQNGILSYPLYINKEMMLLQFKVINQNLNEKRVEYYFAFKNYGDFYGMIDEKGDSTVTSTYHSIIGLQKHKNIIFKTDKIVNALCNVSKNVLDIKG